MIKSFAALAFALLGVASTLAEDRVETVMDGLLNPTAVTIQPSTGHIFVSDSGAGRIIRIADGKPQDVVTGFPLDEYGDGPKYRIGPLGLGFLTPDLLVVGGGGLIDGEDQLLVYAIPAPGQPAINASKAKNGFNLESSGDAKGEGNFYGIAITETGVFVTCNGDDRKGWIGKAERNGRNVGPFRRLIATKEQTKVDAPVAITVSAAGELVVGQMGELAKDDDALLSFYSQGGKLLANFKTGLRDVTGLAYSNKGNLYAVDFSWAEPSKAGLFQLVASQRGAKQQVVAKPVLSLARPSALAFAPDGTLYVTVFGEAVEGRKTGKLLRIQPGL